MIVADQSDVIAFLSRPETFAADQVERIDTHISAIFLAGAKAYKLKRAAVLPYLDFSTLESRRRFCEAEILINRRTAPEIYERVATITREKDGALAFDGSGEAVDYVVVMKRFDQAGLFDRLAERGALPDALMIELADAIARFHDEAERHFDFGGGDEMARIVAQNAECFTRHAGTIFDKALVDDLTAKSARAIENVRGLLDARRREGFVRRCHGDLHLRNVCLYQGRPLLFDAIEFSESLACIDVLYDLAFLLMDLEHRGMRRLGNLVFNRYLAQGAAANLSGLKALPLFLSLRAAVRAHVEAEAAATQDGQSSRSRGVAESRAYFDLAVSLLAPPPARLVAIGGLSGTGKSTLARSLAPNIGPVPGAVVLRSDTVRKQLWGVGELETLPQEAYAQSVTERVYATIVERAEAALKAGHAVIADAVHARPDERETLERLAWRLEVPFAGLWLEAPAGELERRVGGRAKDASDADVAVLRRQMAYSLGTISWRRIAAGGGPEKTLAAALEAFALESGAPEQGARD